jgi:hypothetical protein
MSHLQLIIPNQFFLPILVAGLLQFELEVLLEAFGNDGESTVLPIIPLKVIAIEVIYLMEFTLFELFAFDGRVEPDIITGGSLEHDGAALVLR